MMGFDRNHLFCLDNLKVAFMARGLLATAFAWVAATHAFAQTASTGSGQAWPVKPIRMINGFPAGGGTDIMVRLLLPKMVEALGQQVIVENRPGASGIIAMTEFKKTPADGYSYVFGEVGILAINPSYYKTLPYDPEKDLVPVIDINTYGSPRLDFRYPKPTIPVPPTRLLTSIGCGKNL